MILLLKASFCLIWKTWEWDSWARLFYFFISRKPKGPLFFRQTRNQQLILFFFRIWEWEFVQREHWITQEPLDHESCKDDFKIQYPFEGNINFRICFGSWFWELWLMYRCVCIISTCAQCRKVADPREGMQHTSSKDKTAQSPEDPQSVQLIGIISNPCKCCCWKFGRLAAGCRIPA